MMEIFSFAAIIREKKDISIFKDAIFDEDHSQGDLYQFGCHGPIKNKGKKIAEESSPSQEGKIVQDSSDDEDAETARLAVRRHYQSLKRFQNNICRY
jgi:hypothetical protein